jgi:hypothetical protein
MSDSSFGTSPNYNKPKPTQPVEKKEAPSSMCDFEYLGQDSIKVVPPEVPQSKKA